MRISHTRKLTVNMGNYGEKYDFGASVTFEHGDLGYSDEEWREHVREVGTQEAAQEITDAVMERVALNLEEELTEALEMRDPAEESFIDYAEPKPKKTTRKKRSK